MLVLTLVLFVAELVVGLITNSLALVCVLPETITHFDIPKKKKKKKKKHTKGVGCLPYGERLSSTRNRTFCLAGMVGEEGGDYF